MTGSGSSIRSAWADQRTSQSGQYQCMGRWASPQVAGWEGTSSPHDQQRAKHRQGRREDEVGGAGT
jgi:hypothetical protein